ncbi:MAG: L-threonine 3-dehydrogenase [Theionarchaea archaeon]|nr:MAG: L-threonine 3-dehydrogenase [Theionarchaea archaeon DG-70]MBU7009231.1 L-threonine 3-dehydrogenase [Theionarchaea archaeon]
MTDTMLAVFKTSPEPGGTEFRKVPVPEPGPDDVLIKVKICSICGTDVHIYNWDSWAQNRIRPPLLYGHEFAGEVVEVGNNVEHIKVGDYVSAEGHFFCSHCYQCNMGMRHICGNLEILGVDTAGIFAEYARIPAQNVWKNDPDLKLEYASIQDPLGNAIHTVFAADIPTKNVLILGCGPIGLFATAVCRKIGAAKIFCTEKNYEYRANIATQVGADKVFFKDADAYSKIMEATDGVGVDVVLEFTGSPVAVNQGLKLLRIGGTMVLLGVFSREFCTDLTDNVVFKYVTIQGITGRLIWDTWYRMRGLFKAGLNVDPIITHTFKFSKFFEAMDVMRSGNSGKVVLYMD